MDIFSDIASFLAPVAQPPISAVFILGISVLMTLASIWATKRFTDVEKLQQDTEEVKEWQRQFNEARKTMDPEALQRVMDGQSRIMKLQSSMMMARCKPQLIFWVPFLLVFALLGALYGDTIVAIVPFEAQLGLFFIDPWLGVGNPALGFGMNYYGWYFLSSLGLGNLIRRAVGLQMM
jgi:uncharacterized membrane protein (DUF106 family)